MEDKTLQSVRVRMYSQGFGDCFLVTFKYGKDPKNDFVHMMFDFGVWRDTQKRMKDIAADFIRETGGKLDVLVITHEHKDHLSGFYQKMRDQFHTRHDTADEQATGKLRIDHLWLAWTEDFDNNPLASELRGRYRKAHQALTEAHQKLQALSGLTQAGDQQAFGMETIQKLQENLLELEEGWEDEDGELLPPTRETDDTLNTSEDASPSARKRKPSNEAALEWLKQNARMVSYFKPGQRANAIRNALPEKLTGVQFFVLGPPESVQALRKNESSKEGDLYLSDNFIGENFSIGSVQHDNKFATYMDWIYQTPFEDEYCCPIQFEIDQAPELSLKATDRHSRLLKARTKYLQESDVYKEYFSTHPNADDETKKLARKRRIDYEWLRVSQSLALDMNSHTNNTSLVLAIEIDRTKQVLLFPGDAQFGNWNSWFENNYQWQFDKTDKEAKRTVTVPDLLERTVLYKVSHHGSHNATPQDRGLKLMTRTDLVAMVPVSRDTAKNNQWPIPYDKLLQEFKRRPVTYVLSDSPGETLPLDQPQSKVFKVGDNDLYVEYEIIIEPHNL